MFKCIEMSRLIKIAIMILVIILTVTFIFSNSVDDKSESNKKSDGIVKVIKPPADEISKKITGSEIDKKDFTKYTRKTAHFIEFMILGIELMILMLLIEKAFSKLIFMPLFIGLLVACTDEFIQSFSGRSDMVSDVLLDFAGCFTGIVITAIIFCFIKKRKTRIKLL